jgi:hypothetical protein
VCVLRLAVTYPNNPIEIAMSASNLLLLFGDDFSDMLDQRMAELVGETWLSELGMANEKYRNFNIKDMSSLLKDVVRNGQSALRMPLFKGIEDKKKGELLNSLDDILGERNAWIHRQVDSSKQELIELAKTIDSVAKIIDLKVKNECSHFLNWEESIDIKVESKSNYVSIDQVQVQKSEVTADPMLANLSDRTVGDPITERLLTHSYVLRTTGIIEDRATGKTLESVAPLVSISIGRELLLRKPGGGRIRITAEGLLCAFINDQWSYLAQVSADKWFPGHVQV